MVVWSPENLMGKYVLQMGHVPVSVGTMAVGAVDLVADARLVWPFANRGLCGVGGPALVARWRCRAVDAETPVGETVPDAEKRENHSCGLSCILAKAESARPRWRRRRLTLRAIRLSHVGGQHGHRAQLRR